MELCQPFLGECFSKATLNDHNKKYMKCEQCPNKTVCQCHNVFVFLSSQQMSVILVFGCDRPNIVTLVYPPDDHHHFLWTRGLHKQQTVESASSATHHWSIE